MTFLLPITVFSVQPWQKACCGFFNLRGLGIPIMDMDLPLEKVHQLSDIVDNEKGIFFLVLYIF